MGNTRCCMNCLYVETAVDGKTILIDKKGRCRCSLDIRKNPSIKDMSCCHFHRFETEGELDPATMIDIIKHHPIEVVEEVFLGRKLTNFERPIVTKFMGNYYTIPKE